MKITAVEKQKHNPKRYSVFLDGEFAFGIDEIDLLYYKILKKDELTDEEYNIITENCVYSKAKERALKYIAYKARTEKEVYRKLIELEYSSEIIERVLEFLCYYNYVDDEKYAESYFREKFNLNGYGKERIIFELMRKGVSAEIIEKVSAETEFDEYDETEKAVLLVEKKYRTIIESGNLNINDKNKIIGFLKRRGYSFDIIQKVFSEFNIRPYQY